MILNTVIRSGIALVSKTGKYFNLVSAGGVVQVDLLKMKEQVFSSKMWVGMNLDAPIDFDEIVIRGADGPIEFWAGNVSMNQSRSTVQGANAIRTNSISVFGKQLLTSNDLTRTAVRLRSDKDVFIGGAAVGGKGWRLKANEIEEYPVAGALYGFRKLPDYNLDETTYVGRDNGLWNAGAYASSLDRFVSEDEKTRLQIDQDTGKVYRWSEANGWALDSYFNNEMVIYSGQIREGELIISKDRKEVYVVLGYDATPISYLIFYRSTDDGKTFERITTVRWQDLGGGVAGRLNGSDKYRMVGNVITACQYNVLVALNVDTLEAKAWDVARDFDGKAFGKAAWLDEELKTGIFGIYGGVGQDNYIAKTVDGGQTFTKVTTMKSESDFVISEDGLEVISSNKSGGVNYSTDSLETFEHVSDINYSSGFTRPLPKFWVSCDGTLLNALYSVAGVAGFKKMNLSPDMDKKDAQMIALSNGRLYRGEPLGYSGEGYGAVYQLSVSGDMSPATVEIMELIG